MAFSNLLSRGLGGSPKLKNTGEPPVPRSLLNAIAFKLQIPIANFFPLRASGASVVNSSAFSRMIH